MKARTPFASIFKSFS